MADAAYSRTIAPALVENHQGTAQTVDNDAALVAALKATFGSEQFDALDIRVRSKSDQALHAAVMAAIPDVRYRRTVDSGMFNTNKIRKHLWKLKRKGIAGRHVSAAAGCYEIFQVRS